MYSCPRSLAGTGRENLQEILHSRQPQSRCSMRRVPLGILDMVGFSVTSFLCYSSGITRTRARAVEALCKAAWQSLRNCFRKYCLGFVTNLGSTNLGSVALGYAIHILTNGLRDFVAPFLTWTRYIVPIQFCKTSMLDNIAHGKIRDQTEFRKHLSCDSCIAMALRVIIVTAMASIRLHIAAPHLSRG